MSAFIDSCDPEAIQDDTMYFTVSNPGSPRPWWWRETVPWTPIKPMAFIESNINPALLLHRSMYWHGLPPTYLIKLDPPPWRKD